ncbi:hypothetical protein [Desmospora profundinema]|uniref:Uncharacterized protein n=1 Tax=Desmospora profundinema TaxID=1571184 RepID=A0ABU1INM8_9BACL|nr:hypothetical protein [Desmospora profundinema]MDR6225774.1 hypothetical protein [Desmospora profundinema]
MGIIPGPQRWLGIWLSVFLGMPIIMASVYIYAFQKLIDSARYYPFWLGETFFYLALPAAALIAWKVHWGKKNPFQYGIVTVALLVGVTYLSVHQVVDQHGKVDQSVLQPIGFVDDQLITSEGDYRIAYYPFDRDRLTEAVRSSESVEVTLVKRTHTILAFQDDDFRSYTLWNRLLDLVLGLLATAVFAVLFWVVMLVWWRGFTVADNAFIIQRWGSKQRVPLREVIHIRVDSLLEEVEIDTEEVVYRFPLDGKTTRSVAHAAQVAGLVPINQGRRWVRRQQYEEITLTDDALLLRRDGEEGIPFDTIQSIRWDPVIQIQLEDGSQFTITDERYMDRAWVEEMFRQVRACWEREGRSFRWELDQEEESLGLSLLEEREGLEQPA